MAKSARVAALGLRRKRSSSGTLVRWAQGRALACAGCSAAEDILKRNGRAKKRRGLWIREKLLAGSVPDVPITVDAVLPEDPHASLRARLDVTTKGETVLHADIGSVLCCYLHH